ncbi:MBL fold metallo-hydrolase [Antarcticimicrobium luteum]|uniref:MBL fold metallo-hydrolase n=1 Tax=Antarcticimicrobium luteum TaxID=2547397 RepID=A0A4R5VBN2_9RHOB|nr:MBL fold metallo-hydrolase [Antarcticimicrobium luteum]TDK49653.1 MBL fold metallo-hydrolase [Antarcticimicrobium luteum]
MRHLLFSAVIGAAAWLPSFALAGTLEVQPVTEGIWAIVGEKVQRSPENLANNATFGLVVTPEGAVLVDPGGSWNGARALDTVIRGITDQPVKYVIDTGGQDHRWLGNGYWRAQGAQIIASADAVADHQARGSMQMTMLAQLLGAAFEGTEPAYADITFDETYTLELGGTRLDIAHPGPAHTPGDSYVWIAGKGTVFTGDIVYVERILGVGEQSSITDWPAAFEAIAALAPEHVVPGHGHATTLARARADTFDYLMNLRTRIGALIDEGGDILEAPKVDQSGFAYLEQFDSLAGRNAQTAFQQMEWE